MPEGDLTISAAEANRQFSRLLRAAREGRRVTITSHGQPVAELGPIKTGEAETERRRATHRALMAHLERAELAIVEPWTRDDLYER